MANLLELIRRRLTIKILLALTCGIAIVMGGVIYLAVSSQREQIRERMVTFGRELKYLAYAGIKHPMSVGDSASVQRQLIDVRDMLKGTEIMICDFNQRIVFATHADRINTQVEQVVDSEDAVIALSKLLSTGEPYYEKFFEEEVGDRRYLVTLHRMLNEPECHHCHGASRKVLGGLIIRQATDETYSAIASLRNRTVLISIVGLVAIVSIIYVLLTRLVTRPVEDLVEKAEQLAKGDMSVAVRVNTKDSIGILGESFNAMVLSIKDRIEYANGLRDAIADPLFMVDPEMVVTFMNEACSQLTGYSKAEVEGKMTCRELFNSDICEETCPIKRCFQTGGPVERVRITMSNRNGESIPLMASASAMRDAHGVVVGGVEICKDITDVLEAERLRYIKRTAQREEEQRKYLEGRVENLLGVLFEVSSGNLTVRSEVLGKDDVMDKIAQQVNQMLESLEVLYERISSFSKEMEQEVARRTLMLREKTLLLERANRDLRELDRLKSAFLANMSHELRTPMNSIIGYTDLLIDRVDGEINEEQEKSLHKVENNARHLLQLINDILDMSKIESGKIELDLHETDICELAASLTPNFEAAMSKKGLSMTFDFAEHVPPVYVDRDRVSQIFINLISNAVKFTYQGGITMSVRPSTHGVQPGEAPIFVEVCVADTGIGIKDDDIDKLFDKFSQIDVSSIRQYEGTGLGLSIARGLVVLHKGIIWAESCYGEGSRFCFTLPAQKELLERPAKTVIEPLMAEGLATYFDKPVDLFLHPPNYAGKPIRCWEYVHCGQSSCPAYGNEDNRCWLIFGTHCKGSKVAAYPGKVEFCKACEIVERLILEEEESGGGAPQVDDTDLAVMPSLMGTVLVIDDNPEVIELVRKYIGSDYRVVGHMSGEGAVEKAKAIRPTAITLDIMMPGKNGWHVLLDLKKTPETQDIPVIILSIVDDKKMGFSLGAAEYLVKPIDRNILLKKLKRIERVTGIKRILVADEEPRSVEAICLALEGRGYKVDAASSQEEAVRLMSGHLPDLIVFNLLMHDQQGMGLLEYMRFDERLKNIPLIVLTEKNLTEVDMKELNGRIEATLNKGVLSEKDLLMELKGIIEKM